MKAFTSIKQSIILLKIGISAESADMNIPFFEKKGTYIEGIPTMKPYSEVYKELYCALSKDEAEKRVLPCWSLAALLGLIDSPTLSKDKLGIGEVGWMVSSYPNNCRYDSTWHDNPIDACIEMIIKLNENKYI